MATANTFVQIGSTVTVGSGGAASISFSSIPATYTDLVIVGSTRQDASSSGTQLSLTFNGVGSAYTRVQINADGTSAGSFTPGTSEATTRFTYDQSSTYTANVFNSFQIYIPNYASANYKALSTDGVTENNATTAYMSLYANLWSNTAAITSVTIVDSNASNFVQYSTASLYGILQY